MASSAEGDPSRLVVADFVVIAGYFVIVIGFGIWSSLRNRGSLGGYFLAGRSMHFLPVGASLFASNIGSGHFIGLAGSGAAGGIGIAVFELNALFVLLILGWIFTPVYIASGVYTMPEYVRKRFGGQRIRVYLSVMALLLSIFTKVAADLYAGAVFIEAALKWNLYVSILILLAIAALFTISGGLTAVIWTDFIQTIIMVIGSMILMVISFVRVGGYQAMVEKYPKSFPNTTRFRLQHPDYDPYYNYTKCGIPSATAMNLIKPYDDAVLPWPGVFFGLTISSIWYWCSDQVIVQRTLAAKDLSHAKGGCVVAGYLKILPMWLLVMPGMISRILFPDTIACADPDSCRAACGTEAGCTNVAYPTLVLELMPDGLRGLMLAVMMAALMSSLTSIFNSSSTIFTIDIWCRLRKQPPDWELMIVGRVFVLFMVGIGIAWIPVVQSFSELFHYIQSITSYLAPPVCAIYVLAISSKRINEKGAFWGLMLGLVVGLIRFIWEYSYTVPPCGRESDDRRPAIVKDVHYLHFGILLFAITAVATVVVSLLTAPIPEKYLVRLTFWSRHSQEQRADIAEYEKLQKLDPVVHVNPSFEGEHEKQQQQQQQQPMPSTERENRETNEAIPCWKKSLHWICGIEEQPEPEMSEAQRLEVEKNAISLREKPKSKLLAAVNAIVIMAVAVFLWAFFY